jgi:segregation and condensation protein B
MTTGEIRSIVESLIFASGSPLPLRKIVEALKSVLSKACPEPGRRVEGSVQNEEEVKAQEVREAIAELQQEYNREGRGVRLAEVAGGYQLRTAWENAEYVKMLLRERPSRLSRAALETLAIVAYKQPLTKTEIEVVRGVDVDGVLGSLLAKKLIRMMGRKDVPGRPWVYGTTPQFLELFGLKDLSSLPPLKELAAGMAQINEDDSGGETAGQTAGAPPQDSEPGRDYLEAQSGGTDPGGAGASERQGGDPAGNHG